MSEPKTTNFEEILHDLHGGVFAEKIGRALSDVASGVCVTGRKGKVTVTFDLKAITEQQVQIDHTIQYTAPTANGHVAEKNTTATPMHVGARGRLSLFPETQPHLFPSEQAVNKEGASRA